MPPLDDDEYQALKDSIAEQGVLVAVEYDEDGNVLDGHHRVQACRELGIDDWPRVTRRIAGDDARRRHARVVNLARRHLNREQKRQLIAEEVQSDPDRSDRAIGRLLGVDHKTVGSVRRELAGEIPHPPGASVSREDAERITEQLHDELAHSDIRILCALRAGTSAGDIARELTKGAREGWRDVSAEDFDVLWDAIVQPRIDAIYEYPQAGHYRALGLLTYTWDETPGYDAATAERARRELLDMGIDPPDVGAT